MADLTNIEEQRSNNPPDVELQLTHEQATFMLKNCLANNRLCLALIMGLASEPISREHKQAKAAPIVAMQERFTAIMKLLRAAGAQEPDDD